ncbi:MAG TPA: helix-turn-helix transcriptional regulator [Phycisphaerales bacterium]|nr:helix-turn-helix transcriptional regulator [Phycisphaerales bacterium]
MSSVSEQLRQAVTDSGRTLSDIARDAGVHKSLLTRFMQGEGARSVTIDALCQVLGLELGTKKTTAGKDRRGR